MSITSLIQRSLTVVIGLAVLLAMLGVLLRVWFELQGYLSGDAMIFHTVGRGITNGLVPYRDLFETKPPGIFLVHALSIWWGGNQFVAKLIQALVLLGVPFAIVLPAVECVATRPMRQRQLISLVAVLFGLLLTLYIADQSGYGLAESHGAVFGLWYVGLLAVWGSALTWRRVVILGILMLLTVGFKEPFVLGLLAGTILLLPTASDWLRAWLLPALIAGVVGCIGLLFLGYFEPFFTIYLPHMMGFHVHQHIVPLWVRSLELQRVFINLMVISGFWSVAITVSWLLVPVLERSVWTWVRWLLATALTMVAIAMGGDFYGHHFVFAVPLYAVLFWKLLDLLSNQLWQRYVAGILICCLLGTALATPFWYPFARWRQEEAEYREVAQVVDRVLEQCGFDRYLQMIDRGGGPYAFTEHSPYGPIFIHYTRFIEGQRWYQTQYIAALQATPLIFMQTVRETNLSDEAKQYIGERFTDQPPTCAGPDFVQPKPYQLLFARS